MPFSEPRTKTAVERASASMTFFVITVADIEPDVVGYPVFQFSDRWLSFIDFKQLI